MRYGLLAVDYDGTIAHDGVVDETTVAALRRAREGGLKLVLVTGRELSDLFNTFAYADVFDRIVGENGAVLHSPSAGSVEVLGDSPPAELVARLARLTIPLSLGHSIVATVEPHDRELLAAIRDLDLKWHVIYNKGSVMALPENVTKATGLSAALADLGVSHEDTVGVGDAENDEPFLRACGLAVAVQNALISVKAFAHVVTSATRGAGVTELIDRLLSGELDARRGPSAPAGSLP
jgi:hydroxymethylpyrimidine pyrophosphatase-like HAD family hydrolase